MPATQKFSVLGNYGDYELRSVYPLLQLKKQSNQFIRASFSRGLNLLLDQQVALTELNNLSQTGQERLLLWQLIKSRQLGLVTRAQLIKTVGQLGDWQIKHQDLAAGEPVKRPQSWNKCSLAVINTTSVSGVANKLGEALKAQQFRVVRVDDLAENQQKSSLFWSGQDSECGILAKKLQILLPNSASMTTEAAVLNKYRAEIVIFLGEDYVN